MGDGADNRSVAAFVFDTTVSPCSTPAVNADEHTASIRSRKKKVPRVFTAMYRESMPYNYHGSSCGRSRTRG